jgi:hypothetical protein
MSTELIMIPLGCSRKTAAPNFRKILHWPRRHPQRYRYVVLRAGVVRSRAQDSFATRRQADAESELPSVNKIAEDAQNAENGYAENSLPSSCASKVAIPAAGTGLLRPLLTDTIIRWTPRTLRADGSVEPGN